MAYNPLNPNGQATSANSSPVVLSTSQETILSNIDTDLGTLTETAPASDTASSGLNGRLQRIAQRLTSLIALFPSSLGRLTSENSLSVTLANQDFQDLSVTGEPAQAATVNNILTTSAGASSTDLTGYRSGSVQVVSTASGGTYIFEGSNNNINFQTIPVFSQLILTGTPITAAITATVSNLIYVFPVNFRYLRLRIVTTITGGSIQAFSKFSQQSFTPAILQIAQATAANLNVNASGTVAANLGAGVSRAGFLAGAGIWYDDSVTALAANASFTGTSRDLTVTATATAFANAATYAKEFRVSAESDVAGTLWIEVSRDNTNWRRVKSVTMAAVVGGGFYAEIIHNASWRYIRAGYTNGVTLQTRFTINSIAMAL